MAKRAAAQSRVAIVYENGVEVYPEGSFHPVSEKRERNGKLQREVLERLKALAPLNLVYIADPIFSVIRDSGARDTPLGQGEEVWRVELARDWGLQPRAVRARHYPLETGALVAGVMEEDLTQILKLRGVKGVYPLPLLMAHAASGLEELGFAVFWREEFLIVAAGGRGVVFDVQTIAGTKITPAFLDGELSLQRSTVFGGRPYRTLRFVDSPALEVGDQEAGREEVSLLVHPPEEIGWAKEKPRVLQYLPVAYGFAPTLILVLGVGAYLGFRAEELRSELEAIAQEKQVLQRELSREAPLKARIAELEALLKETSTESPLYKGFVGVLRETPESVLIGSFSLTEKSASFTLHSQRTEAFRSALKGYEGVMGVPPVSSKLEAREDGWKALKTEFSLEAKP